MRIKFFFPYILCLLPTIVIESKFINNFIEFIYYVFCCFFLVWLLRKQYIRSTQECYKKNDYYKNKK